MIEQHKCEMCDSIEANHKFEVGFAKKHHIGWLCGQHTAKDKRIWINNKLIELKE